MPRGTEVILHLKEDAKDFAAEWRIKEIVRRYSSFVPYPIRLGPGGEVVNDQKPIWVEPKSQVTEEQYTRFYQHLTHHPEEKPLWHLHLAADSPIQFRAIVYCPPTNLERLGFARLEHGLSLCAKRVLVQSDCRELVPEYLRFLRGLVDSEDLPLNVSRETLQDNSVIRRIRTSLVKGVLDRLDNLAQEKPDEFRTFYEPVRPRCSRRAWSSIRPTASGSPSCSGSPSSRGDGPDGARCRSMSTSSGCPTGQKRIYYLGGPDFASIGKSPNLEIFRRRGLEVLFLTDPIDEFAITSLRTYQGKDAHLDRLGRPRPARDRPDSRSRTERGRVPGEGERLRPRARPVPQGARRSGQEVRESKRLTDSPCCLVNAEGGMSTQMQRLLKMANKEFPETARILEVNPSAPLIRRLCQLECQSRARGLHQAVRLAALDQRHDPRRGDARAGGDGRPGPVIHGRGRREAVAADPLRG